MEKPIYPLKNMRITQRYNEGNHKNSYAIDDSGKDQNQEEIYAPFSGTIKKINPKGANEVWLESNNPVEYPDGTIDYMTILFAHADNINNLYVGKKINQKEPFYKEGKAGNTTENHCHIECAKGKYQSPGWEKNPTGKYTIINHKNPEDCLWIEETNIIDSKGYRFQKIPKENYNAEKEITIEKLEPLSESKTEDKENQILKLIYTCKKDDLYGIYLKEGEQLYIK